VKEYVLHVGEREREERERERERGEREREIVSCFILTYRMLDPLHAKLIFIIIKSINKV